MANDNHVVHVHGLLGFRTQGASDCFEAIGVMAFEVAPEGRPHEASVGPFSRLTTGPANWLLRLKARRPTSVPSMPKTLVTAA